MSKVRGIERFFGRMVEANCREGELFESPATRVHVAGIYGSEPYNVDSRMIGSRIFYQPKIYRSDGSGKEKMQKGEVKGEVGNESVGKITEQTYVLYREELTRCDK